jgi:hypothetical protein
MLVGSRKHGLWLAIAVAAILLACLSAVLLTRYHRQANPQSPMHEQSRRQHNPQRLLPGIQVVTGRSATRSAALSS